MTPRLPLRSSSRWSTPTLRRGARRCGQLPHPPASLTARARKRATQPRTRTPTSPHPAPAPPVAVHACAQANAELATLEKKLNDTDTSIEKERSTLSTLRDSSSSLEEEVRGGTGS